MPDLRPSAGPLTAIVVGLGQIGMGYDRRLPAGSYVLSHVRALHCHPQFQLLAAVDPNQDLRQQFSADTNLPAYDSVEALLQSSGVKPDVVVIASPTATHPDVLAAVLAHMRPKAILCEKPLSTILSNSQAMTQTCREADVCLFVNFVRRADPAVREVRSRIWDGRIAGPLKAVVWYSKGMFHNGSHFVDLMTYWFGPILSGKVIDPGREFDVHDAEPDFSLQCKHGAVLFCAAREECFSHYTVEVLAANGRLRYERGGEIHWQEVEVDQRFVGYGRLARFAQVIANDMDRYQFHVLTELTRALRGEPHALCTGEEAVMSQEWLERLYLERDSMRTT